MKMPIYVSHCLCVRFNLESVIYQLNFEHEFAWFFVWIASKMKFEGTQEWWRCFMRWCESWTWNIKLTKLEISCRFIDIYVITTVLSNAYKIIYIIAISFNLIATRVWLDITTTVQNWFVLPTAIEPLFLFFRREATLSSTVFL